MESRLINTVKEECLIGTSFYDMERRDYKNES